ncbi:hypothetical protein [Streptomyces sp. NPDC057909]|uniref:hypothetical protein n=1 Tax=Streptomyces sp. NPDC057909 TaxID=3346277 RepID=UPI0036F15B4D
MAWSISSVLSGHRDGESIRYSEIFPALRPRGLSVVWTAEFLDRMGLFIDDRASAVDRWLKRKLRGVNQGIRRDVETWVRTLLDGGPRSEPRERQTAWAYLNKIQPTLLEWSARHDHLREVIRENIIAARDAVTGKQRESRIVALRSLFPACEEERSRVPQPTIRMRVGARQADGVIQPLAQTDIDEAIAAATTSDIRLIIALVAVHAARPKTIRTMQLDDVDLGNRRITAGGHVRPLDHLTRHAVLDWLDHRRNRWPNTANPQLLITQKTAVGLGPPGRSRAAGSMCAGPHHRRGALPSAGVRTGLADRGVTLPPPPRTEVARPTSMPKHTSNATLSNDSATVSSSGAAWPCEQTSAPSPTRPHSTSPPSSSGPGAGLVGQRSTTQRAFGGQDPLLTM